MYKIFLLDMPLDLFVLDGEKMDKKRVGQRELTVKNVRDFVLPYGISHLHTVQQVLMVFEANPKLERIIWALLKKDHLRRKKVSEMSLEAHNDENVSHKEGDCKKKGRKAASKTRDVTKQTELPELRVVVGTCPDCGNALKGEPINMCSKMRAKHGRVVFYKECVACKYFSETWLKRDRYVEIERGGRDG